MRSRTRRRQRAQATVEFALVLPILILLIFGGLIVYSWQLQIDSAQFAAEEGVQVAAQPSFVTGPKGMLCNAGIRAYQALSTQSYLDGTPLDGNNTCLGGSSNEPDYTAGQSCPSATLQTYSSMLGWLSTKASTYTNPSNMALICVVCIDLSDSATPPCSSVSVQPTDEIEVQVTVVGYKALPVALPFFGKKAPFYGQNSQTVQAFAS